MAREVDKCFLCKSSCRIWKHLEKPPEGETEFVGVALYPRSIYNCGKCELYWSDKQIPLSFYKNKYVSVTYGQGLRDKFDWVLDLPRHESDNEQRIDWILDKLELLAPKLKLSSSAGLDIGSGLGVFPYRFSQRSDFDVVALDPDPSATSHMRSRGISVFQSTLEEFEASTLFGFVTINKVLEHVQNPVDFLSSAARCLDSKGIIYIEVPDCAAAAVDHQLPEEFFVEHIWGFTSKSLRLVCQKAGLSLLMAEPVFEPSGKRTIRAMASVGESKNSIPLSF